MSEKIPLLLKKAQDGEAKFFIQFGGQGNSFLREAKVLYNNYPILKRFFEVSIQAIHDFMQRDDVKASKSVLYENGFDIGDWLSSEELPPAECLTPSPVSFPGNQITQLATWHYFSLNGYPFEELVKYTVGATGHSQGLQAAVAISLGFEGDRFYEMLYEFIYWFAAAGYQTRKMYIAPPVSTETKNLAYALDQDTPAPMAVTLAVPRETLMSYINEFNSLPNAGMGIDLSLVNTPNVLVITGHTEDVVKFRQKYYDVFKSNNYGWSYVPVSAPFHRLEPFEDGIKNFYEDVANKNFNYRGSDLRFPVYSFHDGSNLQAAGAIGDLIAGTMVMRHLDWRLALKPLFADAGVTHVLDFGPGKISAILTKDLIKGRNIEVLSAVGRAGMNKLLSYGDVS